MFDDQPIKGPTPPGNLPIGEPAFATSGLRRGEPDDIFDDVDKTAGQIEAAPPIIDQPSALERGILRPKQEAAPRMTVPPMPPTQGVDTGVSRPDVYTVKEPVLARGLITVLAIIVILGILGGGGWWIYNKFIKSGTDTTTNVILPTEEALSTEEPIVTTEEAQPTVTEPTLPAVTEVSAESGKTQDVGAEVKDQQALFGEPIDKDGDGLDDTKEAELATDPNNWDSDGDELSDGDEVLVWKTNPLNPDTDGDKYSDGTEVKGGYNPNGPGKIFEPPK